MDAGANCLPSLMLPPLAADDDALASVDQEVDVLDRVVSTDRVHGVPAELRTGCRLTAPAGIAAEAIAVQSAEDDVLELVGLAVFDGDFLVAAPGPINGHGVRLNREVLAAEVRVIDRSR